MMDIKDVGLDKIILQHFQTLGWETENDISALKDLDVSDIAKLMIKCLNIISPQCDLPSSLPHNMAQRFRCAANIANVIKNLGYHGDLGYQSILYPNEVDLRKLFMFLIEKIPKDSPTIHTGPQDPNTLIQSKAKKKLHDSLQSPWIPPHCRSVARKYRSREFIKEVPLTELGISHCKSFSSEKITGMSSIGIKVPLKSCGDKFYSTLLDIHSEELGREMHFSNTKPKSKMIDIMDNGSTTESFYQDLPNLIPKHKSCLLSVMQAEESTAVPVPNEATKELKVPSNSLVDLDQIKEREGEAGLSILVQYLQELRLKLQQTEEETDNINVSIAELSSQTNEDISKLESEEKRLNILVKTSSLSADVDLNLDRLKNALKASKEKDQKLLHQWTDYKAPITEELNDLETQYSKKKDRKKDILNEVGDLKQQMKSLAVESSKKDAVCIQLRHQKQNLTIGVNRSVYTKQILDISGKVRLQKQQVDKVLLDTRIIQKEINNLTGKLQRTFAAVEDSSYKAASSNEKARPIYRSVVCIHEEFGRVVEIIRATGVLQREIADIKEQVNTEKSKNVEENLNNLKKDYTRIRTENLSLKKRLA